MCACIWYLLQQSVTATDWKYMKCPLTGDWFKEIMVLQSHKRKERDTLHGQGNTLQNVQCAQIRPCLCKTGEREEHAHKMWTDGCFCSYTLSGGHPADDTGYFCSFFSQEGFSLFTFLFLLNSKAFWDLVIQNVCQLCFKIMENTENTAKMSNLGQVS